MTQMIPKGLGQNFVIIDYERQRILFGHGKTTGNAEVVGHIIRIEVQLADNTVIRIISMLKQHGDWPSSVDEKDMPAAIAAWEKLKDTRGFFCK